MGSRPAILALALVSACLFPALDDLGGDAGSGDAALDASVEAALDAGPVCDPSKPFTAITPITELDIDDEYQPTLTSDELEIWFGETLHGDAGNTSEIMHATRTSIGAKFGTPVVEANIAPGDVDPAVSDDGLTLYYSKFGTVGDWDLFVATRPDRASAFGIGAQLPGAIQSTTAETASFVAFDGSLFFVSVRAGSDDVWRAAPEDGGFAAPAPVDSLNSPADEDGIVLTHDGLTAYVTSKRADLGAAGSDDIFVAHRASTADDFGALANETELNGSSAERAHWISRDDCRLYFESTRNRPSGASLYVATKVP